MYSLLSSHVRSGDGRSATYRLAIHQAARASPIPHKGNATFVSHFFTSSPFQCSCESTSEAVHGERSGVFLRILAVEHAVEERDRLLLLHVHPDAQLLHRLQVDVAAQHL